MGRLGLEVWRFKLRRSLIRHLPLTVNNLAHIGDIMLKDTAFEAQ